MKREGTVRRSRGEPAGSEPGRPADREFADQLEGIAQCAKAAVRTGGNGSEQRASRRSESSFGYVIARAACRRLWPNPIDPGNHSGTCCALWTTTLPKATDAPSSARKPDAPSSDVRALPSIPRFALCIQNSTARRPSSEEVDHAQHRAREGWPGRGATGNRGYGMLPHAYVCRSATSRRARSISARSRGTSCRE